MHNYYGCMHKREKTCKVCNNKKNDIHVKKKKNSCNLNMFGVEKIQYYLISFEYSMLSLRITSY